MKKVLITIAATLVVLIVGAFIYISSGAYDISQLSHHNKLTLSIIKMTTHRSIDRRMSENMVPDNLKDSTVLVTGFKHYNQMCVSCHGAPGIQPNEMVEGLYPKPPLMYKHGEEDAAREFFWVIKNGIKMTSMPAFKPTHTDAQIWAMAAFVTQKLAKMSPDEYKIWMKKYGETDNETEAPVNLSPK
ncbi:MAG: cytochrome c [Paludibacter sp.]